MSKSDSSGPVDSQGSDQPDAPPSGQAGTDAPRKHGLGLDDKGHVKGTRSGTLYLGLIVAALLAILVLIFIVQNDHPTVIKFLVFEVKMPIGVAILLAAVVGVLIVAVPGTMRIIQLRRSLSKNDKVSRNQKA